MAAASEPSGITHFAQLSADNDKVSDSVSDRVNSPPVPRRARRTIPVAVLLVAILAQAILMATVSADRQSGSGFAMFSDVDFAGSRAAIVTGASSDGDRVTVRLPDTVADELDALLITPTDARAQDLAVELAAIRWSVADGVASPGGSESLRDVQVVVRALDADGRTLVGVDLAHGQAS